MGSELKFTSEAKDQLAAIKDPKKLKKVRKCLGLLQANPKHPGLNSHKYSQMKAVGNEALWESYVENNTPAAWRVFWYYGPGASEITIITITEHP